MGVDNYFYLFNVRIYKEKVCPAYTTFFKKNDAAPLIGLVEEIILSLDKKPKPPRELYLSGKTDFIEAIKILNGETILGPNDRRLYSHHISNLLGRPKKLPPNKQFVRDWLGRELVMGLCIPRYPKITPVINMMCYPLVGYLYKHSKWIENFFAGVREEKEIYLEISAPEFSPAYLKKRDVMIFRNHFLSIPKPKVEVSSNLYKDYEHLHKILDIAVQEVDITILESLE